MEPMTQTESHALSAPEADNLKKLEKELRQWYGAVVLGLKASRRGRPVGTGVFSSREDFLEWVVPLVRQLQKRGKNPTLTEVAREIEVHPYYEDAEDRLGDVPRFQLSRWCAQYTGMDWQSFITWCRNDKPAR
jgi:hypothetical protein